MQQESTAMRRMRQAWAGIGLPALLIAMAWQAPAIAGRQFDKSREAPRQERLREPPRVLAGLSEDRIISIAEKRHGAKVVRKEVSTQNGRRVYVLRMLSKEGRVWTVKVDAETGGEL
jgi:uncharacterized membrane protein YkoI